MTKEDTNPFSILSTEDLLSVDPIQIAEDISGRKNPDPMVALSIAMVVNRAKKERLQLQRDSHYGMKAVEFEALAVELGFEVKAEFPFVGRVSDGSVEGSPDEGESYQEKFCVMQHPDGVLLTLETYCDNVNNAHIYFGSNIGDQRLLLLGGSGTPATLADGSSPYWVDDERVNPVFEPGKWHVYRSLDVREGFRLNFEKILQYTSSFISPWTRHPMMLSLSDYMTWKLPEDEREDICAKRYQALPEETRALFAVYDR